jgi:hypothetical protein
LGSVCEYTVEKVKHAKTNKTFSVEVIMMSLL